jgi:hypothetical protein
MASTAECPRRWSRDSRAAWFSNLLTGSNGSAAWPKQRREFIALMPPASDGSTVDTTKEFR